MNKLNEITDEIRQHFYQVDPGKIAIWDKVNEIIDWINNVEVNGFIPDRSQVTEGGWDEQRRSI